MSLTSSTTQIVLWSLFGLLHIGHGSVSEMLKHVEQYFSFFFASVIAVVNSVISSFVMSNM